MSARPAPEVAPNVVRVACPHDCPDTCAMLVTVEDGVATKIQGDPSMPFTDGTLCTKVAHYLERTYAPDRLLHPMRRIGKKGRGKIQANYLGRGTRRDRGASENPRRR
jgi:anaerobic selenocysteine-containing dehydrogenase